MPVRASLWILSIPLRRRFVTAGGSAAERTVALVRVGDDVVGWGEAAPYPGQDESMHDLLAAARLGGATPTLRAALDQAVADRDARMRMRSLGDPVRTQLPISVAVGIEGAREEVASLVSQGVGAFKLKVAPGRYAHIEDIRRDHPDVTIGVDGNQSFTTAGGIAEAIDRWGVAYAEELLVPDADAGELTRLAIPHFADEALRSEEDVPGIVGDGRYTGLTIKPGRLGWTGAVRVRDVARAEGIPWRVSGLLETGLGRAYSDRLAAADDAFTSDVAPAAWFLEEDILPSRQQRGRLLVPTGPGVGVAPDPHGLDDRAVERLEVRITQAG